MQKRNLFLSILVFSLLLVGIYSYADEDSVNNPGHSWDEMDCDTTMCVGENNAGDGVAGKIGINNTTPDYTLDVNGNMRATIMYDKNDGSYYCNPSAGSQVSTIYANNWFRAQGDTGIYFQDHGGGWYMEDSDWVRAHNSKPVYSSGEIRSRTKLSVTRESADEAKMELYSNGASRMLLKTGRYGNEAIISVPNNSLYMYIGGKSLFIRGPGGSSDDTANIQVNTVYSTQTKIGNGKLISGTRTNFLLSLQSDRNMVLYDNNSPLWWSGTNVSDIRLKKNITKIDNVLDSLSKLDAVRFNWIDRLDWGDKKEIGLIAQEVEKDFPELVYTDKKGYKLIDYEKITPLLLTGIQEQQEEIENLKERLEKLENDNMVVNKKSSFWQRLLER